MLDQAPLPKRPLVLAVVLLLTISVALSVLPAGSQEPFREKIGRESIPTLLGPAECKTFTEKSPWKRWERVPPGPSGRDANSLRLPARWLIQLFKRYISPVDGSSCTFSPTCSTYGMQAIRKHGIVIGIPITAERVMRDHHPQNPARYPLTEGKENYHYLDTVESNDFWWAESP